MAVVASFTSEKTVGMIPFYVQFTDTSTGSPDHWWWNFGDGSVGSEDQNPTHTYLCKGTYTVTLTSWIETGSATVTSTVVSTEVKYNGYFNDEAAAWTGFLAADLVDYAPNSPFNYRFYRSAHVPARWWYHLYHPVNRLDLTPYSAGSKIITLQYVYRFLVQAINCSIADTEEFWISNDQLNDIPILKFCCTGGSDVTTTVQMISSPDIAAEFEHAGTIWDLELKLAKRDQYFIADGNGLSHTEMHKIYEQSDAVLQIECVTADIAWQRIGQGCIDNPAIGGDDFGRQIEIRDLEAVVHTFSSQDSVTSVNYITANSMVITKPAQLYSGIKESYFKDGWENEKYLYIEQDTAHPCVIQFVDVYAETENDE